MRHAPLAAVVVGLLAACGPAPLELPAGPGASFPDYRTARDEASASCAGVRTWTAEIGLSGRAGRVRLRGRVAAGLARPDSVRLEGMAPFGQPLFILVARGGDATLLLPRDRRVMRGEPAAAILEALTGVAIGADALRAVLTGCVAEADATGGRAYADGRHAVDLGMSATVYLRQASGHWRIEAGSLPGLAIQYGDFDGARPRRVRLRAQPTSLEQGPAADLTLTIAQADINVELPEQAFTVRVPADATPLTLDELRDAGPLGTRR
jgi:hypothetical protein